MEQRLLLRPIAVLPLLLPMRLHQLNNQLATQEDSEGVFATKFCGVLLFPREDLHGDLGPGVRQ